jgi:hypothetical protein
MSRRESLRCVNAWLEAAFDEAAQHLQTAPANLMEFGGFPKPISNF